MLKKFEKSFPRVIALTSAISLLMAFLLTLDKFKILADPSYIPPCNINPLISCGSIMSTPQASLFGFPNPLLGLIGFSIVLAIGVGMLAGAKFKRWYWNGFYAGILFAIIFVHWLIHQSLYAIGHLCPNCMVVWAMTMPLFYYTLIHFLKDRSKYSAEYLWNWRYLYLTLWYLLVIGLILHRFWDFWSTLI